MPIWKQLLLAGYYYGTHPMRRERFERWRLAGRSPVSVLFYHRIAPTSPNSWTATPRQFERQIRWLKKHFDLVSLAESQRRIASGLNCRPAVAITFDDGYAENCDFAIPLLISQKIPCTYFVSTRFVLDQSPFPHDASRGKPLQPNTPQQLREMAAFGIELGVHTRTHADLGAIADPDRLHDEVVVAKDELEQISGRAARYFAFPYGQHANLNADVFRMAREAGYAGVCSAYGGFNFPGDDAFHLQRIHGDPELLPVKNWVTVDPRKLRSVNRYRYGRVREEQRIPAEVGA